MDENFIQEGYQAIKEGVRMGNSFPSGQAKTAYTTFTQYNLIMNHMVQQIIGSCNNLLTTLGLPPKLTNTDIEGNMEKVVTVNDSMLENLNLAIDVLSGLRKKPEPNSSGPQDSNNTGYTANISSWNAKPVITKVQIAGVSLTTATNIVRPQMMFKDAIDNSSSTLWTPKIKEKPNNKKPLALQYEYDDDGVPVGFEHPYLLELESYHFPKEWSRPEGELVKPSEEGPLTMVNTEADLDQLVAHLLTVDVFSVDVEHHSYRSFQGITCLLQITTEERGDFIIDTLVLRDSLYKLNEAFTHPRIVKVLHGASQDVVWLQRDLAVYLVGVFDTHQAGMALDMRPLSLRHLVKHYCSVDLDKTHQMSDWRIRPLPQEMVNYARMDTHYLIYVYKRMKQDLLERANGKLNLLLSVVDASTELCKQTYRKEVLTEDSWKRLIHKSSKSYTHRQLTAMRLLYRWRDDMARAHDESVAYVLPSNQLLALAEALPRDIQGVNAICQPMPPLVSQNIREVHRIILSCERLPIQAPAFVPGPKPTVEMPTQYLLFHLHHQLRPDLFPYGLDVPGDHPLFKKFVPHLTKTRRPVAPFQNPPQDPVLPTKCSKKSISVVRYNSPYIRQHQYRLVVQEEELRNIKKQEQKVKAIGLQKDVKADVLKVLKQTVKAIETTQEQYKTQTFQPERADNNRGKTRKRKHK